MKSILSFALLAILLLQFEPTDANGKTNPRPSKTSSGQLPVSLHQSPKARLLRRIVAQQAPQQLARQQPIQQRPIAQQRPIQQQPQQQRPIAQQPQKALPSALPQQQQQQISVAPRKASRPRQVQQQQQQRPISQAPRRVKVVKVISQSPQKSQRPIALQQQQQPQQLQQPLAIQSTKSQQRPRKSRPVLKKVAQLPAAQQPTSQGPLPSDGGLPPRSRPAAVPSEGGDSAPTANPNSLGSNNDIGLNNDIRDRNRISASNSISSSNTIRASNSINADNSIRSSNAIGGSNAIESSNSISSSNRISAANRINADNSITSSNSISASNTIDATNIINDAEISNCGQEGYSLSNRFCDKFYQCARLGNTLKLFEFQCTGGLVFDLNLKVCNYPRDREGCAFLYTGEGSDDGSYNENDLLGLSEPNSEPATGRLVDEEESSAGNSESSELEAQPPERSGPVTEGSNAALAEAAPSGEEDSEATW